MAAALLGLGNTLPRQLGTDRGGPLLHVAWRARQAGQPHGKRGIGKRVEPGGGHDLLEDGRGVAVAVKAQAWTQGEKSRRQSGQWPTGS